MMTLEDYDNTLPLFLGGPFHGEIRLVRGIQDLLGYRGTETSAGFSYQRWVLAAGGREWVFYRTLGMSDADALAALVNLAASSPKEPHQLDQKSFPGPCGSGNETETKNKIEIDTSMWIKVIAVLSNALLLAKADPADKQEIRRLTQENSDLAQQLAASMAACPSNEDREKIANLVDEFAAAIPVVEPVTSEPSIAAVDPGSVSAPIIEPTGSSGDVAPPSTPFPGDVGTPVTAPAEVEAPVAAAPADAVPEAPVASVDAPVGDTGASE